MEADEGRIDVREKDDGWENNQERKKVRTDRV